MMDKCDEQGVILHDFAQMLETLKMIKVKLDKSELSPEL